MHWSLTSKANARFIVLWLVLGSAASLALASPARLAFGGGAFAAGLVGGWLQLVAMRRARVQFLAASNAMSVRNALASTVWGRIYLVLFWVAQVLIFGSSVATQGPFLAPLAIVTGYCAFAAAREAVSFAGVRELERTAPP